MYLRNDRRFTVSVFQSPDLPCSYGVVDTLTLTLCSTVPKVRMGMCVYVFMCVCVCMCACVVCVCVYRCGHWRMSGLHSGLLIERMGVLAPVLA